MNLLIFAAVTVIALYCKLLSRNLNMLTLKYRLCTLNDTDNLSFIQAISAFDLKPSLQTLKVSSLRLKRDVTTEAPKCKQGDAYEHDCNTCTCNELGLYVCTRRACYDGPQFPDTAPISEPSRKRRDVTTEAPKCKQGDAYEHDCNTCTCNELGLYVCTRRACYDGPQFPDTASISEPSRKRREIEESTGKYDPPRKTDNILSYEIERCAPNEIKNKVK